MAYRTFPALVMLAVTTMLASGAARADGMAWVEKASGTGSGSLGKAIPKAQRAVLYRNQTLWQHPWSLTLEAKYERPEAGAGWLVPFPHCPVVSEGNPQILSDLGMVTAPIFVQGCMQTCQCGTDHDSGCAFPFGGGSGGTTGIDDEAKGGEGSGSLNVDVWQSGTIGALDFVVLSADDPAAIPQWLDENGYDNPPELAAFVTEHAADYDCYFAAKLAAPATANDVFPAVSFVLNEQDPPFYPLRLTRLGLSEGETLDLTIWVVNPEEGSGQTTAAGTPGIQGFATARPDCLLPARVTWVQDAGVEHVTETSFRECMEAFHRDRPGDVAITFDADLDARRDVFTGDRNVYCQPRGFLPEPACLKTDETLPDAPATFSPAVAQWLESGLHVVRYETRLPASALDRDLVFTKRTVAFNDDPYAADPLELDPTYLHLSKDCGYRCSDLCAGRAPGTAVGRRDMHVEVAAASFPLGWLVLALPLAARFLRRRRADKIHEG